MTDKALLLWGPNSIPCSHLSGKNGSIQASAHLVMSKAFLSELQTVFPEATLDTQESRQPIVIATMQHAAMELVRVGTEVDSEKDFLLERVSFVLNTSCHSDPGYVL
jgi:hypothetical protein